MTLQPCRNCGHPIREHAAECGGCGSSRTAVHHVRLNRGRPLPAKGALTFRTKLALVYIASLCAALVLSVFHEGIVPTTSAAVARTLAASGGNFAVACWFALIPRSLGIAVAFAALAVRTYAQWTGYSLIPLF